MIVGVLECYRSNEIHIKNSAKCEVLKHEALFTFFVNEARLLFMQHVLV